MSDWQRLPPEDLLHTLLAESIATDLLADGSEGIPSREALSERAERIASEQPWLLPRDELAGLVRAAVDRLVGLGPLQPLLDDPEITEIMVNDPTHIFVERNGRLEASARKYASPNKCERRSGVGLKR